MFLKIVGANAKGPGISGQLRHAMIEQDHCIVRRLSAVPGVTSAGFATVVPMVGGTPDWDVMFVEGRDYAPQEIPPMRFFKHISPGYLATMGTRLVAGRDFTWTDLDERRRVLVVSENMARELWGSAAAAIGKRVRSLPGRPWREVVGVVQNVHEHGAEVASPTIVYWPTFGENPYQEGKLTVERKVTFTVRSQIAGHETLLASIRRAVWTVNSSLSVANERTMSQIYDASMERASFALVLLGLAGAMTFALGVIGIYGAIAYAVSQQRREIGIRVALGASPAIVTGMFVRRGVILTGVGVFVGLIGAVALTRVMASLLFGISPLDPLTYVAVSLLLVAAAATASYIPARKASAVDPVKALRAE